MKGKLQNKPSKASLISRGLAAKSKTVPSKNKTSHQKKKTVPDSKPGYALYSTDSEADQVAHVKQGLDRCANLLSNILDGEQSGVLKPLMKGKRTTSSARPKKLSGKLVPQGGQTSASRTPLLIPTATKCIDEASPSPQLPGRAAVSSLSTAPRPVTVFNDRLTASTPVLNAEQRKKQQDLMRREQKLQQQLLQLTQHYDLLQQQKTPEHQEKQKRSLQNDMLHQLNNSQLSESNARPSSACLSEARTVLNSGMQLLSESRNSMARRSLDYAVTTPSCRQERDNLVARDGEERVEIPTHDSDPSVKKVKQVRIISPSNENAHPLLDYKRSSSAVNSTAAPPIPSHSEILKSSPVTRPRSAPPGINQNKAHPTENQIRTLLYLVGELRSLLGSTGDVEVDRLMTEIEHVSGVLPLLVDQLQHHSETVDIDLALQPLRFENSQLRRKLRIANQKLQDQESTMKNLSGKQTLNSEVEFEMAACKSVNKVLQDQLREEKESKEKILRINESLSKSVSELQEEKRNLLQLLSEKDQDYLESKRGWQQETSKACVGTKQMHAELKAAELASQAARKENKILTFALKQKDKEIERLKELTRSSQQSLTKLLSNVQQFQPNGVVAGTGYLQGKATALGKLDKLLSVENNARISVTPAADNGFSEDFKEQKERPENRTKKSIRFASPEMRQNVHFSRGGSSTADIALKSPLLSPGGNSFKPSCANRSYGSDDLSSVSSKEEAEFKQDLADLDANIARLQRNLREALVRN